MRCCAAISGWKAENEIRNPHLSLKLCRNPARHCRAKPWTRCPMLCLARRIPLSSLLLSFSVLERRGLKSLADKIIKTFVRRTPLLHGSRSNWPTLAVTQPICPYSVRVGLCYSPRKRLAYQTWIRVLLFHDPIGV